MSKKTKEAHFQKPLATHSACAQKRVPITASDLPLSCPPREDRIWDAHPRVYLPIEEKKKLSCPYCGTEYVLSESLFA